MIPNWHFFTGPAADLEGVWNEYGIRVHASCGGAIAHSSIIYFIAPDGTERYIAAPMGARLSTGPIDLPAIRPADWRQGIALVARNLIHWQDAGQSFVRRAGHRGWRRGAGRRG